MDFAIDCGNSFVKWQFNSDATIHKIAKNQFSPNIWEQYQNISRVLIGSVTSSNLPNIVKYWQQRNIEPIVATTQPNFVNPITIGYHNAKQLGVDRYLQLLAAYYDKATGHSIIVDCGSAVTVDLLLNNKHFRGGYILPNQKQMVQLLRSNEMDWQLTNTQSIALGRSTESCISNGCSAIVPSLVRYIIATYCEQQPVRILISGGYGEQMQQLMESVFESAIYRPNLIFEGLHRYADLATA